MQEYRVRVYREDGRWMVEIPDIDSLTQATTLREATPMARDCIAAMLDIPVEDVEVTVELTPTERSEPAPTTAIRLLDATRSSDVAALQDLLDASPGYTRRVTGHDPRPGDAAAILTAVPPTVGAEAKVGIGVWDGPRLVAFADLLLGYPDDRHAYVGLLIVAGDRRGEGLGGALHDEVVSVARATPGIGHLALAIVDTNRAEAEPFWRAQGYHPTGSTAPYAAGSVTSIARRWARAV